MIKTLLAQVKEYKTPSLLAPLCAALEVFFDMSIPFVISKLIDQGIQAGNMAVAMKFGLLMLFLAICGLTTGFLAGKFAAEASAGFAANLREGMYDNIQTFAFSNIDKYSTAGGDADDNGCHKRPKCLPNDYPCDSQSTFNRDFQYVYVLCG